MKGKFFRKNNAHSRLFDRSYFDQDHVLHVHFNGQEAVIALGFDDVYIAAGNEWTSTATILPRALRDAFRAMGGIDMEQYSLRFSDAVDVGEASNGPDSYTIRTRRDQLGCLSVIAEIAGQSQEFTGYLGETKYRAAKWISERIIELENAQ